MFQFRVGRIPVEVHFSHLLISGLIALSMTQAAGGEGWPGSVLRNPSDPDRTSTVVLVTLVWMFIVTFSVLVHEFGHAIAARVFGYSARIQLVSLVGLTHVSGAEGMPWHKDVLYSLAGPSAGLALSVISGLLWLILRQVTQLPEPAAYALSYLAYANMFWTLLNLAPVATLDGGRIAAAILTRAFGRRGFLMAQMVSVAIAGSGLLLAVGSRNAMLGALMVLLGLRTAANIVAYNRGVLPSGDGAHPLLAVLQTGEAAWKEGRLDEAQQVADSVLAQRPPPVVTSRAHFLLAWVALKRGQGRKALDHFAQVQGITIPPQAAAAAFTLVGDEARALPLWAAAASAAPEDTVILHEFAGALLRANREADARRLPGIRLARAWLAAERVYYVRGDYTRAALMAEAAFREEPSASLAYDAGCDWARANDATAALRMLALASQNGFKDRDTARNDPDLASLTAHPGFISWLESLTPTPASAPST